MNPPAVGKTNSARIKQIVECAGIKWTWNYLRVDTKKVYCSWEICDYFSRCTWEEYWESEWRSYLWFLAYYPQSKWCKEPNYEESYRDWWRAYKMK